MSKTFTIELTPTELRVLNNGLNHQWDHLRILKNEFGRRIAVERDEEERDRLTACYDRYHEQQAAVEELQRKFGLV